MTEVKILDITFHFWLYFQNSLFSRAEPFPIDFFYKCIILNTVLGLFESCLKYSNVVLNQGHSYKNLHVWWWREENCGMVAEGEEHLKFVNQRPRVKDWWYFWPWQALLIFFIRPNQRKLIPGLWIIDKHKVADSLSVRQMENCISADTHTSWTRGLQFHLIPRSHSTSAPLWMVQGSAFL